MGRIQALLLALCLSLSLPAAAAPVDINRADAAAIAAALQGIGPKKAAAIVAHRRRHGPFRRLEDLLQVKGIGPKLLERNRHLIRIVPPEAAP